MSFFLFLQKHSLGAAVSSSQISLSHDLDFFEVSGKKESSLDKISRRFTFADDENSDDDVDDPLQAPPPCQETKETERKSEMADYQHDVEVSANVLVDTSRETSLEGADDTLGLFLKDQKKDWNNNKKSLEQSSSQVVQREIMKPKRLAITHPPKFVPLTPIPGTLPSGVVHIFNGVLLSSGITKEQMKLPK